MLNPFSMLEEDEESAADFQESMESIGDIPRETLWALILGLVFAHVGLFATGLGLMLVGIQGWWTIGGTLVIVGIVALAATVVVLWRHRAAG